MAAPARRAGFGVGAALRGAACSAPASARAGCRDLKSVKGSTGSRSGAQPQASTERVRIEGLLAGRPLMGYGLNKLRAKPGGRKP